jgi:hypothetical protein
VHDRDGAFANVATIAGSNIEAIRTAPRSPRQNVYVERVIGSIRRECLDHVIVVNDVGLRRVLASYVAYYTCPSPKSNRGQNVDQSGADEHLMDEKSGPHG